MRWVIWFWIPFLTIEGELLVSIDVRNMNWRSSFLVDIPFCKDCSSPEHEGSLEIGLLSYWSRSLNTKVNGRVVYGIPNHGEKEILINAAQLNGNVAFLDRGKVEVLTKARRAQQAGAVALIIADDGSCTADLSYCGRRAGGSKSGFAPLDETLSWAKIHIPVLIITSSTAEKFRQLMVILPIGLPFWGLQNVSEKSEQSFYWNFDEEF